MWLIGDVKIIHVAKWPRGFLHVAVWVRVEIHVPIWTRGLITRGHLDTWINYTRPFGHV
jgi:hypothetical protein